MEFAERRPFGKHRTRRAGRSVPGFLADFRCSRNASFRLVSVRAAEWRRAILVDLRVLMMGLLCAVKAEQIKGKKESNADGE